ncbi:MAG TPA: DAK2 domain-containing protein, partial [Bacillota bacterium]
MTAEQLDGPALRRMLEAGAARLREGEAGVNALNVFPVPDGDTGRNMSLTMQAVLEEVRRLPASAALTDVARAAAAGSLRGARGNSGVILSQFFRGLDQAFRDADRTSPPGVAAGFRRAADTAYQMVMRPVEGTILTVMRAAAEQAERAARTGAGVREMLELALQGARETLARTPDMLPVLKRAGVIDAGGQGLVHVLEGFVAAHRSAAGEVGDGGRAAPVADLPTGGTAATGATEAGPAVAGGESGRRGTAVAFALAEDLAEIRYPYDVELFILSRDVAADALREQLGRMGDSVIVVPDEQETKVHLHTDAPAAVLELCLRFGPVHEVQILNMQVQHAALY